MFKKSHDAFLTGNEIVVRAAQEAGAEAFFGYPITPATEILHYWAEIHTKDPDKYKLIHAEDETAAGFMVIGALLNGHIAFTATAGPGTILMQDGISMAEAIRLPFVGIIVQRGGPSTGSVIYSQQEVTLTCHGGNGEGLRIVYSASSLQDLYDYTIKAFHSAWQYRFPTFVLSDGYLAKTKGKVKLHKIQTKINTPPILGSKFEFVNLHNSYNIEEELFEVLTEDIKEYERLSPKITEHEEIFCRDAESIIFAHGSVASACRVAVERLRAQGLKIGFFRAITLRPFPKVPASHVAAKAKKILVIESSNGQFEDIVRAQLYGLTKIEAFKKPALGFSPTEIIERVRRA